MLEFDDSRLRAQVVADYLSMEPIITDAQELNDFVDTVMMNAFQTVRELMNERNQSSALGRISPAVLAASFAYLPFPDRISLSHVCRSWRAAALSEPALWCPIQPQFPCTRPELLEMALSRAGSLAIDIDVHSCAPAAPDTMYSAIAPFSRQIRYLSWRSEQASLPWDFPAPNLEVFCHDQTISITDSFFGGQAGRLRCLYLRFVHLPARCPALSTVTELTVAVTPFEDTAPSTLGNLFDLFPRLGFLNIRGITRGTSHLLPAGAAPVSIRELWVSSRTLDYDLLPHILAWDSGNLHHISLRQCRDTHPNLERLATGTVTLAVAHTGDDPTTYLTFKHSETICHSMALSRIMISKAAALLAAVQPSLCNVQCAMVSHVALIHLARVLAALPLLASLFVHIRPKPEWSVGYITARPPPREFDWRPIADLADLACSMPALRAITLHVWCDDRRAPRTSTADEARGLLAQLRTLPADEIPPIEIQGFDADTVASIDLTGLNVRFDVDTEAGPLVLWKRREAYDPFR